MRLLRWIFALAFALTVSGCLWRPPPIPPDRAAQDSGSGFAQDTGAETPREDGGGNGGAADAADSRDAHPASDAAGDADSSDADSSDADSSDADSSDAGSNGDS